MNKRIKRWAENPTNVISLNEVEALESRIRQTTHLQQQEAIELANLDKQKKIKKIKKIPDFFRALYTCHKFIRYWLRDIIIIQYSFDRVARGNPGPARGVYIELDEQISREQRP